MTLVTPGRRLEAFVVAAPGLESVVLGEVVRLGVRPARITHGGVECELTLPQLWSLHLHLRVATRVLVRAVRFKADGFETLKAGIRRVDWSAWLRHDMAISVDATADRDSKLYHSGAVAERVAESIGNPLADAASPVSQTVLVRVQRDVVTVSIDASGPSLHQRGYRQSIAKAPLRETLAAACVIASGWDRRVPLVDPFCGSGTIAIEAAMWARKIAPGRHRTFAFQSWPSYDEARWHTLLAASDADVMNREPEVWASDRDAGAVQATLDNAARAGVTVRAEQRSISDLVLPTRPGWIVTNPPYGVRVGEPADLRNLFDRTATVLAERAASWQVAVLAPTDSQLLGRLRLSLVERLQTTNGGLPVTLSTTA
jgi:putative N6-adenine-specific DNA methylase